MHVETPHTPQINLTFLAPRDRLHGMTKVLIVCVRVAAFVSSHPPDYLAVSNGAVRGERVPWMPPISSCHLHEAAT